MYYSVLRFRRLPNSASVGFKHIVLVGYGWLLISVAKIVFRCLPNSASIWANVGVLFEYGSVVAVNPIIAHQRLSNSTSIVIKSNVILNKAGLADVFGIDGVVVK